MRKTSRKRLLIALFLAGVPLAGFALAQTIDGLDLQAVAKRSGDAEADAQALAREVERRSAALREEALTTVAGGEANLAGSAASLSDGSAGTGAINFDAIVAGAAQNGQSGEGGASAPQLIVFASLSMPAESLKPLIRDTARAGGAVVFNGFPGNSMKAFQQGVLKVVEDQAHYANLGVDPRLFRAFQVTAVPAFVVVSSDFAACEGLRCETLVPPHDRMSGNVTLAHALTTFAEGGGPGAAIAGQALRRLQAPVR